MERRMGEAYKGGRLRLLGVGECLWRVDSVVSVERRKRVWGGGGGMDGPDVLLPSERVKEGALVEEVFAESEGASQEEGEEEMGQEWGHGAWARESGDGEAEWEGGSEELLRRLDEEFMRRETSGEIPKRKTQRVRKEEVLAWGVIREGIYGIHTS